MNVWNLLRIRQRWRTQLKIDELPADLTRPSRPWSVTVWIDGEPVLTIAHCYVSGRELSTRDIETIRKAGEQLLAFVGN